jgi:hypothetical protein
MLARKRFLTFFFILLLAFALRLYRLDFQSIWWDEGHSILMASAPLAEIPTTPGMDVHPPGFFALLHLWMGMAGESKFALRYFSVGFSLLTVALLMRFGRHLGRPWLAEWAGLLMALSPFFIAYAQEVRMYAMAAFFATGSMYCLWRLIFSAGGQGRLLEARLVAGEESHPLPGPPPQRGRGQVASPDLLLQRGRGQVTSPYLLFYIVFTAAGLYTHYFTIFLLAFQNLLWLAWFLRRPGRRGAWLWGGSQLGVLLLFGPQLALALRQATTYANPNLIPPEPVHFLSHNWQAYTLGLATDPGQVQLYLWGLLAVFLAGLVLHRRDVGFWALLLWLLAPMGLFYMVLQGQPSYEPRYLMVATPPIMLLFAMTATARRWTGLLGLAVAGIFLLGLNGYFTDSTFFKDDADAVVAWLAAETTVEDVVLVDVPHPFHYYADQIPAPTRYLFVDIHTAADTLNRVALGRDRLYWVTWWGSDTDPRGVIPYLLQKQAGPRAGEMQFRGYRVDWYNLSQQPFSLPTDLTPIDVNFEDVLRLDGLAYGQTLAPGQSGWATLHFSQLAPIAVNYKVSLRLRAPDGRLLAQDDRLLLNDRHFQTSAWPLEDPALNQATNVYTLPLNDPTYHGPLTLEAVVYNAGTLAAIAAYGVPTTNDDLVSSQIGQVVAR